MAKFENGKSGNPGGRPRADHTLRDLMREEATFIRDTLKEIAGNRKARCSARVAALQVMADRGWGKPTQPITGADDAPLIPSDPVKSNYEIARRLAFLLARGSHELEQQHQSPLETH